VGNANIHAAVAASHKDLFVPSTREMAKSSVYPTPPRPSPAKIADLTDIYADPNPNPAHSSAPTSLLYPEEPYGDSQSFVTDASSAAFSPSVAVTSFSPPPVDHMGTVSRSRSSTVTAKGKKGMLGFMTDVLNSHKRPEISTAYDPAHLTHVGFDSFTRKYIGLPKIWQQLLRDSGISEFDQETNPLAILELVKFYQEHFGGGDVWDKMGHWQAPAQGISPLPPIPSAAPAAYPGASKSVTASAEESRNSPNADDAVRSQATVASNGTVAERPAPRPPPAPQQRSAAVASLVKAAGATPRRREKKKEDKANEADMVRRLRQICTDADPTRLYRNLVKIGQG
jgi:p21-activated kinase 1